MSNSNTQWAKISNLDIVAGPTLIFIENKSSLRRAKSQWETNFDTCAFEDLQYLKTIWFFSLFIRWSSSSQILVFTINTFSRQRNQSALSSKVKTQLSRWHWVQYFSLCQFFCVCVSGNNLNGPNGPELLGNTEENNNAAGDEREPSASLPNNKVPVSQPPRRSRDYSWRLAGATECSATCGKGKSHQSSDVFSFQNDWNPRNIGSYSQIVNCKIDSVYVK